MRNLLAPVLLVVGMLAVGAPLAAQAAPTKVGFLDTRRIIQVAPGAEDARATLDREMAGWRSQLEAMDDSLTAMATDLQQRSSVMNAEARARGEQQIRDKQAEFQQRAEQLQQQAGVRQEALMQPIMERVEAAISEVRQAGGYAIIFDAASEAIVSADPSLDITEQVIQRLQAAAPAASRRP